jgi:hypothetical protein
MERDRSLVRLDATPSIINPSVPFMFYQGTVLDLLPDRRRLFLTSVSVSQIWQAVLASDKSPRSPDTRQRRLWSEIMGSRRFSGNERTSMVDVMRRKNVVKFSFLSERPLCLPSAYILSRHVRSDVSRSVHVDITKPSQYSFYNLSAPEKLTCIFGTLARVGCEAD